MSWGKVNIPSNAGKGAYAWKVYEQDGETLTFVDYAVSNKENAYPEDGLYNGKWYRKVGRTPIVEGDTLILLDEAIVVGDELVFN